MIEVLMEDHPGDIELAVESINRRSRGWRRKLRDGLDHLPEAWKSEKQKLQSMLVD